MEVALRYWLLTLLTLFTLFTLLTLLTLLILLTWFTLLTPFTLFTLLTLKSLCGGWMDGTDGSHPLDCYNCHEYSRCTTWSALGTHHLQYLHCLNDLH